MESANRLLSWAPPMGIIGVSSIVHATTWVICTERFSIVHGLWTTCESIPIFARYRIRKSIIITFYASRGLVELEDLTLTH